MLDRTVCVVGLGYIGLPTASLLATKGFSVTGVDINEDLVDAINAGNVPIYEPGLDVLVKSAVNSGNLTASLTPLQADVFIIAVPTPFDQDKSPDLSYLKAAIKSLAKVIRANTLVIIESTSPVGTCEQVTRWLDECCPHRNTPVHVAYCPERVIPGNILEELIHNDRIVGGVTATATELAAQFYRSFIKGQVLTTSAKTAEFCKLSENAFRDVNIAFANELSMICDELDIDVWEAIALANHHPRVNILKPGPGVGGHCIAVDPWFIVASAPNTSPLLQTARKANDNKPLWVIDKVTTKAKTLQQPTILCLGVTYKADVDDTRESPALNIIQQLIEKQLGDIIVADPYIEKFGQLDFVSLEKGLAYADIIVILTDHTLFKEVNWSAYQHKTIIDTRGVIACQK